MATSSVSAGVVRIWLTMVPRCFAVIKTTEARGPAVVQLTWINEPAAAAASYTEHCRYC